LGSKWRRLLELKQKSNRELFALYEGELAFRHHSKKGLEEATRVIRQFRDFIGESPPSPELAKSFLAQFKDRKPTTIASYGNFLKVFLKWYGEELDIKFKVPKVLPGYVQKEDIEKLIARMASKKTHKKIIQRDTLLVNLAIHTGLRRSELAHLRVGDIDIERRLLVVRQGKGAKDRVIPLSSNISGQLDIFTKGKSKDDSLFGLTPKSVSGKIRVFARKAGVPIHTHSLRDYFATHLSEKGATIREIQSLLGHTNLTHTERYTLHTDKHLRKAVELLDKPDTADKEERLPEQALKSAGSQAMVTIKGIYKYETARSPEITRSIYFSYFVISNEGKEAAVELEAALLDNENRVLEGRREPVLNMGEKLEWEPNLFRPDGLYYLVCQYKKMSSVDEKDAYQTLLQFNVMQASKLGEVYVATKQLEFKFPVKEKDKLAIF